MESEGWNASVCLCTYMSVSVDNESEREQENERTRESACVQSQASAKNMACTWGANAGCGRAWWQANCTSATRGWVLSQLILHVVPVARADASCVGLSMASASLLALQSLTTASDTPGCLHPRPLGLPGLVYAMYHVPDPTCTDAARPMCCIPCIMSAIVWCLRLDANVVSDLLCYLSLSLSLLSIVCTGLAVHLWARTVSVLSPSSLCAVSPSLSTSVSLSGLPCGCCRVCLVAAVASGVDVVPCVAGGLQVLHQVDELVPENGAGLPYDDLLAAALLLYFGFKTLKVGRNWGPMVEAAAGWGRGGHGGN